MAKDVKETAKKLKEKRVGFFADFKAFIMKGNVIDLAVAVVIGNAFNAIVNGLVKNVITPVITLISGNASIDELKWVLKEGVPATETTEEIAEVAITYGAWLQTIIDFFIIALCIFTAVRLIRSAERKLSAKKIAAEEAAAAAKKAEDEANAKVAAEAEEAAKAEKAALYAAIHEQAALLREIRDSVKK